VKIFNPRQNLAAAQVRGIDFETSYRMEPDFFGSEVESLSLRAIVGVLKERSTTSPNGTYADSVNTTVPVAYPEYTGTLTANYGIGPVSMQWQQRFISESDYNNTWIEGVDIDDNTIPFYSFSNVQVGYRADMDNGGSWTVTFNVNNLFDKAPALVPAFGGLGGQGSGIGDEYGRRYQLGLNVNF
jgi:outer membrane receptor protein involved in Fe transport